ncbi:MAG: type II toxin-antitoxin system HipA family toxin, partial [Bacteroidota bacterium]
HWVSKQTLSVNGKRLHITKDDLLTIAKNNSVKKGEKIIDEINAIIKSWNQFAKQADVQKNLREKIYQNLNTL